MGARSMTAHPSGIPVTLGSNDRPRTPATPHTRNQEPGPALPLPGSPDRNPCFLPGARWGRVTGVLSVMPCRARRLQKNAALGQCLHRAAEHGSVVLSV